MPHTSGPAPGGYYERPFGAKQRTDVFCEGDQAFPTRSFSVMTALLVIACPRCCHTGIHELGNAHFDTEFLDYHLLPADFKTNVVR